MPRKNTNENRGAMKRNREVTNKPSKKNKQVSADPLFLSNEILCKIISFIPMTKKGFKRLCLVSKDFYWMVLTCGNLQNVQKELTCHIAKHDLYWNFGMITRNESIYQSAKNNFRLLGYACVRGDVEYTKILLDKCVLDTGGNPTFHDILWQTCKRGHTEIVQLLIADKRMNPGHISNLSLSIACKNGYYSIVELLLNDGRVNANYYSLCEACESGNVEVVKLLIDRGTPVVGADNKAFWRACQSGHVEVVKLLLQYPELNPCNLKNEPLFRTAYKGKLEVAKMLLADQRVQDCIENYDLNGPKELNSRVLQAACESGNVELVKMLLQDPRFNLEWKSVFSAAARGHLEILELLLNDVRISSELLSGGLSIAIAGYKEAMNRACHNGHLEVVKRLLPEREFNPFDNLQNPGIYRASLEGHLEIVKLLAQDKRCTIKFINEALCCACSTGKLEVAEFLLKEMNADPNHYTSYKTLFEDLHFPLEVACLGGHDNVVKLLLKDPRVTVSQSDFDVACRNGKASVVNIFLSLPTFSPIDKSVAFTDACKRGFIEVVVLILKDGRIDPSFDNNEAFIEACKQSNLRIVELLLNDKRVDPSISDYAGLKNAILSKNTKVYKLLLRDTRINPNQKKCKIPELRKLLSKGQTMADLLK